MSEPQAARTQSITINGERRLVPAGLSIAELLMHLGMDSRQVAVECNRQLVKRAHFADTPLRHGDELEIVTFFGGG